MPEKGKGDSIIGTDRYSPKFLLSKKNPEIIVARRRRGHVHLKYIVWESSFVMEQRVAVQFSILRKLPARNITAELKDVYRHEALSLSAVKKWHRWLVNGIIKLEDDPWSERSPQSNLYGSIQALIDETPFISCKYMCQKLWIPKTTYPRVLQGDPGFRK
jgi:hypothetical protein